MLLKKFKKVTFMKRILFALALIKGASSYSATINSLDAVQKIQAGKILNLESNLEPQTKVLNLKPTVNNQVFENVNVDNIETIYFNGDNKHSILKSLSGGVSFQKVTILKHSVSGSLTVSDARNDATGNIHNMRQSSVILQASGADSMTLMKTPAGWMALQQPRYFELRFGSSNTVIWFRDAKNNYHSISHPTSTTKVVNSSEKIAVEDGKIYLRLPDFSTQACHLLRDDDDLARTYTIYLSTDGGNNSKTIWDTSLDTLKTLIISRGEFSATTATLLNPIDNYASYKVQCFY